MHHHDQTQNASSSSPPTTTATTATTAMNGIASANATMRSRDDGDGSVGVAPATVLTTTYFSSSYGGGSMGLYHQQNIRANSIGAGMVGYINGVGHGGGHGGAGGGGYPNTINGNVNILLGGAMLSLVTTVLCVVCYCCHRNIKKRTEAAYRQQRQWLENDPNMEIYSVEQCYETSGLFLGESTDALATLPPLHHEPPPSYDAVLVMQQQQLLLEHQQFSRISPPPGYRSSLTVSALSIPMLVSAPTATCSSAPDRGMPDGMAAATTLASTSTYADHCTPQRYDGKCFDAADTSDSILQIKKVLNAHSCCSLQRAEVENMWNAAAAAVAARTTQNGVGISATVAATSNEVTPHSLLVPRKSLPTTARLAVNEIGRRYMQHKNLYRRGCPLCGKFRYDADDALSLSTESGLDSMMPTQSAVAWQPNPQSGWNGASPPSNCNICNMPDATSTVVLALNTGQQEEDEDCLCYDSVNGAITEVLTSCQREAVTAASGLHSDTVQLSTSTSNKVVTAPAHIAETDVTEDPNGNILSLPVDDATTQNNHNAMVLNDHNENAVMPTTTLAVEEADMNLDTINENGLIRLDMSRIIDHTGLPTYEAALTLDSSGYV